MNDHTIHDCVIIGAGGVGSAAAFALARRGQHVVAIDRFNPPHDRGSSHGETRAIRTAYFEHPDYVPLARRAYELWDELMERSGRPLFERSGVLQVGPADGYVIQGVLASAREHGLDVEQLSPDEVTARYPAFRVPPGTVGLVERDAGFLRVEDCIDALLDQARTFGAHLQVNTEVTGWTRDGDGDEAIYRVETDRGDFRARALVITAGPWAPQLVPLPGVPFERRRKVVMWFATRDTPDAHFAPDACPVFLYELPGDGGIFYGFPQLDGRTIKVGEHSGGEPIADPLAMERDLLDADRDPAQRFVADWLPGVNAEALDRHSTCIYTMSPDDHFVVGTSDEHPRLAFAAGLSGHGFKFVPVLGEALADLVTGQTPRVPLAAFAPDRPGLRADA